LPDFAGRRLVHLDDLADFIDRKTEPLAAQDLADEMAVRRTKKPGAASPYRLDQPLILIKPQRSRRDIELSGQFGDRIIFTHPNSPAERPVSPSTAVHDQARHCIQSRL